MNIFVNSFKHYHQWSCHWYLNTELWLIFSFCMRKLENKSNKSSQKLGFEPFLCESRSGTTAAWWNVFRIKRRTSQWPSSPSSLAQWPAHQLYGWSDQTAPRFTTQALLNIWPSYELTGKQEAKIRPEEKMCFPLRNYLETGRSIGVSAGC